MPIIRIIGSPGTGKSTVVKELVARGFVAFDTEGSGIARYRDRSSGEVVSPPPAMERPANWHRYFTRSIERHRVEEIAENAKDSIAFLGGLVENDAEVWDLYDQVVCLVLDDETLRDRLLTRTTNEWGKAPSQLAAALGRNAKLEASYRDVGAVILDASQPIDTVVESIIAISRELKP